MLCCSRTYSGQATISPYPPNLSLRRPAKACLFAYSHPPATGNPWSHTSGSPPSGSLPPHGIRAFTGALSSKGKPAAHLARLAHRLYTFCIDYTHCNSAASTAYCTSPYPCLSGRAIFIFGAPTRGSERSLFHPPRDAARAAEAWPLPHIFCSRDIRHAISHHLQPSIWSASDPSQLHRPH